MLVKRFMTSARAGRAAVIDASSCPPVPPSDSRNTSRPSTRMHQRVARLDDARVEVDAEIAES